MLVPTILRLAMVTSVAIGGTADAAGAATAFEVALKAAQANVSTPEGQEFDAQIGKQFGDRHVDSLARCTQAARPEDLTRFDLLFKLDGQGRVVEVLVRPGTKVALCLQRAMAGDVYTKPRKDGYWVRVEMSLTP